ncbi:hypothetical protein [Chitinimonas sp. BJB300]|uniref:hypothetical protein n=1 Tax=Chitinimonas sp. BJB300 TaxID=1559339 RepID=UPI000C10B47A|nr:hypothetical protein [Chitinimonas sp. BJB300]PHV09886.1 hypothetical protein CSQ89_19225 [Chitinimonas sp. BJB300]
MMDIYTQGLALPTMQPNAMQDWASLGLQQQNEDLARLQDARNRAMQAQQKPLQQGLDPQLLQHLMAGEGAAGSGAGAAGASGAGSAVAGGSAASGSAGASAGGSALLNPWTALAAAAIINEREAKRGGYRREGNQYYKDLLTGKNVEQDINQRWAPKIGGKDDKFGVGSTMRVGGELLTGDFTNAGRAFDDSTAAKLVKAPFKAIKKLF